MRSTASHGTGCRRSRRLAVDPPARAPGPPSRRRGGPADVDDVVLEDRMALPEPVAGDRPLVEAGDQVDDLDGEAGVPEPVHVVGAVEAGVVLLPVALQ